jgi:hypothetical protein
MCCQQQGSRFLQVFMITQVFMLRQVTPGLGLTLELKLMQGFFGTGPLNQAQFFGIGPLIS